MEAMEAILSRRSIRKYTDQPVPGEVIDELMQAAMAAPTANNQQDWQFVVVTDREILDQIPQIHAYAQMAKEAPMAIVVCGDLKAAKLEAFWVQDCAAATQNILVAITAKGLGGVWCGVHPRQERVAQFQELLGLPQHVVPFCLIVAGYPAEQKPRSNRYDAAKVHHNRW